MGVATITANVAMTAFIILRAIELTDWFFIFAFVATLSCHPQQLPHTHCQEQCKRCKH